MDRGPREFNLEQFRAGNFERWRVMREQLLEEGWTRHYLWEKGQVLDWNAEATDQDAPSLYIMPVKPGKGMLIICAGGGFAFKTDIEAKPVAERFYSHDINAAVLDYRVQPYDRATIMKDGIRALRWMRAHKDAKYVIDYCGQSLERAKNAMQPGQKVIRIGVSLMTKNQFTVEQWFRIQALCPNMTFTWVPFTSPVNRDDAYPQQLLKNVDFVAGLVDQKRFDEIGCQLLEISKEPIRVAVPLRHSLSQKDVLEISDLYGQRLMFSWHGWNSHIDAARIDLQHQHPQIRAEECAGYNIGTFNRCAEGEFLVTAIDAWRDVHPMVLIKPVNWSYTVPYGLMYSLEPSKTMKEFLEVFQAVIDMEEL